MGQTPQQLAYDYAELIFDSPELFGWLLLYLPGQRPVPFASERLIQNT